MLKSILLLLMTFNFSFPVFAKAEQHILQCLGKEEEYFFIKKIENSKFMLNQLFIHEFTALPRFTLKNNLGAKVCSNPGHTSHHLLLVLIEQGPEIIEGYNLESYQTLSLKDGMDQFFANIPEFFLQYVSSLQIYAPTINCLEKNIPELKKYLESINAGRLVEGYAPYQDQKKNMISILKKTMQVENIYKKCTPPKVKKSNPLKKL